MESRMMGKRGFALLSILFAIVYFMIGMIAYQYLKPVIAIERDSTHMNCAAPTSHGGKVVCLMLDGVIPIVIIAILSSAGGIATNRFLR